MMMNNLKKITYPSIGRILTLTPNPHILLGRRITWEVKRDGSCVYAALDETDTIRLKTNGTNEATSHIYDAFNICPECDAIRELLLDARRWSDEYIIFFELMEKGISPTRTETHAHTHLEVFDIWSVKSNKFFPYTKMHQDCYHVNLPVVEVWGVSISNDIQHLWDVKNKMLDRALDEGKEGVVGKTWGDNDILEFGYTTPNIYFKEKLDTPKYEEIPTYIQDGETVVLPPLPEGEIRNEVHKVYRDLELKEFRRPEIAMPRIAKAIGEECKKQNCRRPHNITAYYYQKLEDIIINGNGGM